MKKFISWVLCLTLLLFPAQQAFAANDVSYERIAGSDRYLTSVEISKHSFQSADTVVIASGVGFADALTGGFNLGIAFATGYAAGRHVLEER